jgi:hypothetical protein
MKNFPIQGESFELGNILNHLILLFHLVSFGKIKFTESSQIFLRNIWQLGDRAQDLPIELPCLELLLWLLLLADEALKMVLELMPLCSLKLW